MNTASPSRRSGQLPERCPSTAPRSTTSAATSTAATNWIRRPRTPVPVVDKNGGNTERWKPEKSKNFTLGLVLEPINNLTAEFDFWSTSAVQQPDRRAADDSYSVFSDRHGATAVLRACSTATATTPDSRRTALQGCPGTALRLRRLPLNPEPGWRARPTASTSPWELPLPTPVRLASLDFNFELQSTWVHSLHKPTRRSKATSSRRERRHLLGRQRRAAVFRWQHNALDRRGTWSRSRSASPAATSRATSTSAPERADVSAHKVSGIRDLRPVRHVHDVLTKALLGFTVGVRNVFDREPPFSNQDGHVPGRLRSALHGSDGPRLLRARNVQLLRSRLPEDRGRPRGVLGSRRTGARITFGGSAPFSLAAREKPCLEMRRRRCAQWAVVRWRGMGSAARRPRARSARSCAVLGRARARVQRGAMRIAPSRRITSPLSISFVTIWCTSFA